MMDKKFKLTENKKQNGNATLYQIEALKDFDNVKKGGLGGWIEKEENLSQDGNAWVYGDARVYGNAWVYGDARVYGNARVCGNAEVYGNARVYDNAEVYGNALIENCCDIICVSYIGSRYGTTTVFKTKDGGYMVCCGCFRGTLDEFAKKVSETHGDNKYGREYKAFIELCKIHFGLDKAEGGDE